MVSMPSGQTDGWTDAKTVTLTLSTIDATSIKCNIINFNSNNLPNWVRLEARLQPNIGFTVRRVLAVFMRLAITPPKVNRFGWNLEYSDYIVRGWPWQISGAICTVATAGKPSEILFFFVRYAWFHRFPVGQISRNLDTTCRSYMSR